ncbi:MAG: DUF6231 family protein [Spongiibacteraceae bacterium]
MSRDPRHVIADLLETHQPQSLLLLSPDPHAEWKQWCQPHAGETIAITAEPLAALEPLGRVDMALVIGMIETLDKGSGEQVIGRLRNVHTEHIYVLIGDDPRWHDTDWFGLAMQRVERFAIDGCALTLYGYDLATYNRVRSWNNPRYWANPDNWNRYWW